MMDAASQQKQEALFSLLKKLKDGTVPVQDESIPMVPAPLEEMTPEKAKMLDEAAARNPASVKPSVEDMTEKSDMIAVPLEKFMPAGFYDKKQGEVGMQPSPDVADLSKVQPEEVKPEERLAKIKLMLQNQSK